MRTVEAILIAAFMAAAVTMLIEILAECLDYFSEDLALFYKKNRSSIVKAIKCLTLPLVIAILVVIRLPKAVATAAKDWWRY